MPIVLVPGANGYRARCFTRYSKHRWQLVTKCGACARGNVKPALGSRCVICRARVVDFDGPTPRA